MNRLFSRSLRWTVALLPRRFWWFGLACGVVVSLTVTGVMTAWEWIENPGGLFRDGSGTRWNFVRDTAVSWLIPTFLAAAAAGSAVHLAVSGIGRFLGRPRVAAPPDGDGSR